MNETASNTPEQCEQMLFSSLAIMFKVLKTIRMQDSIGQRPVQRYLFAVACIAAANQCDKNILGKPLFIKSLSKATFIAQNYAELSTANCNPADSLGLLSYEQWNDMFFNYLIHLYNKVLQALDVNIEVVYPIDYISAAIPLEHPSRANILAVSRQLLLEGPIWSQLVNNSLFYHPREIAVAIFEQANLIR